MIRKVLNELAILGYTFRVNDSEGPVYIGAIVADALDNAHSVDMPYIRIIKNGEVKDCILYLSDLAVDEQIADCLYDGPVQKVIDTYFSDM